MKPKQIIPKGHHKITFAEDTDLEVAFLGSCGFHTKAIARRTKMSESMVQYRLSKAKIKRKDYRDCNTQMSKVVIETMRPKIAPDLQEDLLDMFTELR